MQKSPFEVQPTVLIPRTEELQGCVKIRTVDDKNLGFQMALFCSSCKPPIVCPKFQRNYAIQRPLTLKTSISKTSNFEISKISISAPDKLLNKKAKCRSSLSSPGELEEGPPSSVIIFIKGTHFSLVLKL